jgi:hypothetical protein
VTASAETGFPRLLVVGGQSRNIGKTALVVDLIRAFPQADWVAAKITQYGHGVCAMNGETCDCAPRDHGVALDLERDPAGRSDTSRFLAAGARRALWLRVRLGQLDEGWPLLLQELRRLETSERANVIIESNSLLGLVDPSLCLMVLDPAVVDFKASARQFLHRADAFVVRPRIEKEWQGVPKSLLALRPVFCQTAGEGLPDGAIGFVRKTFFGGSVSQMIEGGDFLVDPRPRT